VPGLLTIEHRDAVALVTLRRPERRNALSIELREEIADAFPRLAEDSGTGAIVLTGAGSAFCSGMDVDQFGGDRAHRERLVESSVAAFDAVRRCAVPVLAAVNGPAVAGGFALALLCDVRIAGEAASFGFPELGRGIPPSYAAARAALPSAVARELCLTGRVVDAETAVALGIACEVAEDSVLVPRSLELAAGIAARPRWAILETKRRILLDAERAYGHLFADEAQAFREAMLRERPEPAA
jgi:enoyl-CoA hydratase/carnithine racemase